MLLANRKADGVANVVNNRSLPAPHIRFRKALGRTNNFSIDKAAKAATGGASPELVDEDIFDPDAAKFALGSPSSKTTLNPLFQNTSQFDITKKANSTFKSHMYQTQLIQKDADEQNKPKMFGFTSFKNKAPIMKSTVRDNANNSLS